MHHVLLDTDIGSDVDDALALGLTLGRDDVDLLGVTTVYGDTLLRAQIARRYLQLSGRDDVDTVPGIGEPLSGRAVWWPGHEGTGHSHLASQAVRRDITAAGVFDNAATDRPGEVDLVAIGPLTNVADGLLKHPQMTSKLRGVWIMGGAFDREEPEHNIISDTAAAQLVFQSSAFITVLPLEVTERVQLTVEQVDLISESGPVGEQLGADIRQWWQVRGTPWNVPHDPLTVLAITNPELFSFTAPGVVTVEADSGRTTFSADSTGTTRIATDLDTGAVARLMVEGICRASRAAVSTS